MAKPQVDWCVARRGQQAKLVAAIHERWPCAQSTVLKFHSILSESSPFRTRGLTDVALVICDWACAHTLWVTPAAHTPMPAHPFAAVAPTPEADPDKGTAGVSEGGQLPQLVTQERRPLLDSDAPARQLYAVRLLRASTAAQRALSCSYPPAAVAVRPAAVQDSWGPDAQAVLQRALTEWLGGVQLSAAVADGDATCARGRCVTLRDAPVASLLLLLLESGSFCAPTFLRHVVASGLLQLPATRARYRWCVLLLLLRFKSFSCHCSWYLHVPVGCT